MTNIKYKTGDVVFFNWNKNDNGKLNTNKIMRAGIRVAQYIDILTDGLYSWDTIKKHSLCDIQYKHLCAIEMSKWTHVGIITAVNKTSYTIHEALSDGFIKSDYDKTWFNDLIESDTISILRSKIKLTKVKANAEKYEGTPYGWIDLVKIGLGIILKLIPFSRIANKYLLKTNPITSWFINLSSDKQIICVEADARILYDSSNKVINVAEEKKKTYDTLTVSDLYMSKYLHQILK